MVSKWRVPRMSKPTPRATTIALGTSMGIIAALASPHVHAGDNECTLFQARLETSEYPALELRLCATVPSPRGAVVVRYDIAVRVAIMPAGLPDVDKAPAGLWHAAQNRDDRASVETAIEDIEANVPRPP